MSNIVHDKYHRQNHHSFITSAVTDMGLDPIASKELPFSGEFVMDNADHDDWILSSDRAAFEWVSGYNDVNSLKFDVDISGAIGKTIIYPSGEFGNIVIANGRTDVPSLSVVGKSIFTDDIVHDGNLTVSTINTTGISAGNILISGNDGFALNVTNGLSKFNDVTGGNFTITGNTGVTGDIVVGGDLNVHENLYFTSGIANGGFLNVSGSAFFENLKVSGKIEATNYYFERTTGINIPSDGGWKLSGTLSDEEKPLIPGKDSGAIGYTPGINNLTLSAMGLSSDSWASFGGNVLIDSDKFYVDAGSTVYDNSVRFKGDTSAVYFSADNGTFSTLTGENVQFNGGDAHTFNVASASAEYMFATAASGENVSANNLYAHILTLDDIYFNSPVTNPITATSFKTTNGKVIISQDDNWGSGLVETENIISNNYIVAMRADRAMPPPDEAIYSDNYKVRVPNIGFCDEQYFTPIKEIYGSTGFGPGQESTVVISGSGSEYLPYNDNPGPGESQPPCNIRTDEKAIAWYNVAKSRIYVVGNHSGGVHRARLAINQHQLSVNKTNEFCFDFYVITDGNITTLGALVHISLRKNGSMSTPVGTLRLADMYGPSGGKLTVSDFRMGRSGTVRTLARMHFMPNDYAIVEILGAFNGNRPGSDQEGWFK